MATTDQSERSPSPDKSAASPDRTEPNVNAETLASVPAPTAQTQGSNNTTDATETLQDHSSPETESTLVTDVRPQDTEQPNERISPEAESLKAMFPDFDTTILQSVLDSVNGDQERAADVLLGMSDPNYVSQQHTAPSQSELDEQLARRLLLEEEQLAAAWHPDRQYPLSLEQSQGGNLPYQPRTQHGAHHDNYEQRVSSPSAAGGGKDTMAEVQEQFNKFAETGKKTFSSIFSKVKAKMQEFDQSRNPSGSAPQGQTSWGSGTPSGVSAGSGAPTQHNQYSASSPPPSQPPPQGQYSSSTAGAINPGRVQGYDAVPTTQPASNSPASAASVPAPADRIPPRPPSAGPPPAGNVDPTKIGMLPKRPVSLLSSSPPQTNVGAHRDADDDELDYVENPFEEGKK